MRFFITQVNMELNNPMLLQFSIWFQIVTSCLIGGFTLIVLFHPLKRPCLRPASWLQFSAVVQSLSQNGGIAINLK